MTEITYGTKHDSNLTTTEIAKRVRTDIKEAIKAGHLPEGLKCSVRTSYFSGGSSIDVDIKRYPGVFLNVERVRHDVETNYEFVPECHMPRYTDEAREVVSKLESLVNAYNFDGSDIQTDYFHVKFYGHVDFDHDYERQVREDARIAIAETTEA